MTSHTTLVAEELEVEPTRIEVELAAGDRAHGPARAGHRAGVNVDGGRPVQRTKARRKARGSEKPSRSETVAIGSPPTSSSSERVRRT